MTEPASNLDRVGTHAVLRFFLEVPDTHPHRTVPPILINALLTRGAHMLHDHFEVVIGVGKVALGMGKLLLQSLKLSLCCFGRAALYALPSSRLWSEQRKLLAYGPS